jgi:hypothetical protein
MRNNAFLLILGSRFISGDPEVFASLFSNIFISNICKKSAKMHYPAFGSRHNVKNPAPRAQGVKVNNLSPQGGGNYSVTLWQDHREFLIIKKGRKRYMPTLRGHHLICLHFFRGEGYSPEFISRLCHILNKAEEGETVRVGSGPDDVCNICMYVKDGRCSFHEGAEQEIQAMDGKALELLELKEDDIVHWLDMRDKIPGLFGRWSEEYCMVCSWRRACEKNAFFRQLEDEKAVR